MIRPNTKILLRLSLFTAVSFLGLLLGAEQSSPLSPSMMWDYGVFRSMGLLWARGGIPYVDLLDNKGPFFFLIQMIAVIISQSKWSIFIIETLFLVINSELVYRIAVAFRSSDMIGQVTAIVFIGLVSMFAEGGNTVEEYSLPFQLLPFLWAARMSVGKGWSKLKSKTFLTGICFGLTAMIRLDCNAIISGVCIGIIIMLFQDRRPADVLRCAALFIAGALLAVVPFMVYFAYHDALGQMIESVFLFGFKYKEEWLHNLPVPTVQYIMVASGCIVAAVMSVIAERIDGGRIAVVFVPVSLIYVAVLCGGAYYLHYFIMLAPVIAMVFTFASKLNKTAMSAGVLSVALIMLSVVKVSVGRMYALIKGIDYSCDFTLDIIPPDERDSVYLFNSMRNTGMLYRQGHIPVGKYMCLQETCAGLSDELDKITRDFEKADPLWIIAEEKDNIAESPVLGRYMHRYRLMYHAGGITLYRRKE